MLSYEQAFCRLCNDGWLQGWHERNGGNLSYVLTNEEMQSLHAEKAVEDFWVPIGLSVPDMAGACLLVTGSGKYLRNVQDDPRRNAGTIEINADGTAWRIIDGFEGGGRPTSELPSHLLCHAARKKATNGSSRVLYHAHAPAIVELSFLLPLASRDVSRALWKSMTECPMVFPQGVGVLPWMLPGSLELAQASAESMNAYDAIIWAHHGIVCAGNTFDDAFGLLHTIEKAARMYLNMRAANGGSEAFLNQLTDDQLRAVCDSLGVKINEAFLD